MARWVAIVLAASSRINVASILTDALTFGHNGIFRHNGFGGKDVGPRRLGDLESRGPCDEGDEGRTAVIRRFPVPWRIVEIPNGFVVNDAAGQQLGIFYGRADPNTAGHTGYVTLDEAREFAADFASLPELLKRD